MSDIAIKVQGVSKDFEIYSKPSDVAWEVLTGRKRHRPFRALDDVTFDVLRGEVLGIIGANGAGKSTLLKIITGVLEPTMGSVEIAGKVTAILELGLGFNPEYSGRENIYLSGLLYGMDRAEINRKVDSIIEFSGLAAFIEQPVKTYSSGMHSRLAFSIATSVDPDILIIDEALAAGDAMFVQKCMHRIQGLCGTGKTVLVVSHGTGILAQLCRRVMWLDAGRVRALGPALTVVQAYDLAAHQGADPASWLEQIPARLGSVDRSAADGGGAAESGSREPAAAKPTGLGNNTIWAGEDMAANTVFRRGPVFIDQVELIDAKGVSTTRVETLQRFGIRVYYRLEGEPPDETLGVALAINQAHDLAPVVQWFSQNIRPGETHDSYNDNPIRPRPLPAGVITLDFPYMPLRRGDYILSIGLLPNRPGNWLFYEYRHFFYHFSVDDAGLGVGAPVFLQPIYRHGPLAVTPPPSTVAADDCDAFALGNRPPTTLREEIHDICIARGGYPDQWPRHSSCPACGARALRPSFGKYGFSHDRCDECGFICVNPYPTEQVSRELYAGLYYSLVREYYELPRLRENRSSALTFEQDILREAIHACIQGRPGGSWLDVGGGLGAFALSVQELYPGWTVCMNEWNPRSRDLARKEFGLRVVDERPEVLAASNERFDVVSMVAVLEHCAEPARFLSQYLPLLRAGGLLVIMVPHFSRLNSLVSHGSSPVVVPPFHLSLFTETNLRTLLQRVCNAASIDIRQLGGPAFLLHEHVPYGDKWDITIPDESDRTPRSVQVTPYLPAESEAIAVLSDAGSKLAEYFAAADGRNTMLAIVSSLS